MSFGRFARAAAFIARQDMRQLMRERETLVWVFVMPVVFFYFIGTITGGMSGPSSRTEYIALDAPGEPGILADQLARRLTEQEYEVVQSDEQGLFPGDRLAEEFHRRLVLPADFTARIAELEPSILRFEREDGGIANDFDNFRITRAVFGLFADLIALGANGFDPNHPEFAAKLAELDQMERSITLEVKPAGKRQIIPSGFDQAIPGILVMFVLMQGLTGTAVLLVVERRQGLLRRLAATPITRSQIITGKWIARMIMGLMQVAVGLIYGSLFFSMDWGPDFGMLLVVLFAWAGFCASAGLLVGSIGRTEGQVVGLGVLSTMVLAALGGCWWPIEVTPHWMQSIAQFLPSGWAMDALHQLVNFQNGAAAALGPLLWMSAGALALGVLGVKCFRYS
jgi:ABC transporter DrrB family efflux protein